MKVKQLLNLSKELSSIAGKLDKNSPNKAIAKNLKKEIDKLITRQGFNLGLIEEEKKVEEIDNIEVSINVLHLLKTAYESSKGKGAHSNLKLFGGGSSFKTELAAIAVKYFANEQERLIGIKDTLKFLTEKIEDYKLKENSELKREQGQYEANIKRRKKEREDKFTNELRKKGWGQMAEEGWITQSILNNEHNKGQPLYSLPYELMITVFSYFSPKDKIFAGQASKYLHTASTYDGLWRTEMAKKFPEKVINVKKETYRSAFIKACLNSSSFIVHRRTYDKYFTPMAYFNTYPSRAVALPEIFESIGDAFNYLWTKTIRGTQYIVEINLPRNEVEQLQAEKKYDELLRHVKKVHSGGKDEPIYIAYDGDAKKFIEVERDVNNEKSVSKNNVSAFKG